MGSGLGMPPAGPHGSYETGPTVRGRPFDLLRQTHPICRLVIRSRPNPFAGIILRPAIESGTPPDSSRLASTRPGLPPDQRTPVGSNRVQSGGPSDWRFRCYLFLCNELWLDDPSNRQIGFISPSGILIGLPSTGETTPAKIASLPCESRLTPSVEDSSLQLFTHPICRFAAMP
jgi:hypothetical protein